MPPQIKINYGPRPDFVPPLDPNLVPNRPFQPIVEEVQEEAEQEADTSARSMPPLEEDAPRPPLGPPEEVQGAAATKPQVSWNPVKEVRITEETEPPKRGKTRSVFGDIVDSIGNAWERMTTFGDVKGQRTEAKPGPPIGQSTPEGPLSPNQSWNIISPVKQNPRQSFQEQSYRQQKVLSSDEEPFQSFDRSNFQTPNTSRPPGGRTNDNSLVQRMAKTRLDATPPLPFDPSFELSRGAQASPKTPSSPQQRFYTPASQVRILPRPTPFQTAQGSPTAIAQRTPWTSGSPRGPTVPFLRQRPPRPQLGQPLTPRGPPPTQRPLTPAPFLRTSRPVRPSQGGFKKPQPQFQRPVTPGVAPDVPMDSPRPVVNQKSLRRPFTQQHRDQPQNDAPARNLRSRGAAADIPDARRALEYDRNQQRKVTAIHRHHGKKKQPYDV